jgi:hypothetical protein
MTFKKPLVRRFSVAGQGSDSNFRPEVYPLPGLASLVPRPPAPRSKPFGLVRLEMRGVTDSR